MTRYLGVDCGLSGALAVVETINGIPTLVDVIDMPIIGSGAKARVNVLAVVEWIRRHAPSACYLERAQAMPKQGASSGFIYGRSVGAIESAVMLCEVPLSIVEPSTWKRSLRFNGGDKEGARQRAIELFPQQHAFLARRKDHGRAEAALLVVANLGRVPHG
jgi:crossover junction endodeoxyribonuclease RuvC